jgi:hypothetical protein
MLESRGIGNGLCPRAVSELADKLANDDGFREGLKQSAPSAGGLKTAFAHLESGIGTNDSG